MKRLYALLLALILTLPVIAETVTVNGLKYSTNSDGTCTLTGYSGDKPTGSLTIPPTIQSGDTKYTVTTIGLSAFSGCSALTAITIPASVTEIGNYAFDGCTAIKEITLEDGERALIIPSSSLALFHSCPLEKVYIGRTLSYEYYDASPFGHQSNLTSLTIGKKVTSIGHSAFAHCSALTSVTIPSSVTVIGDHAFNGCTALASIVISNSVTLIDLGAFNDCLALTSITIPASVTEIGTFAFDGCKSIKEVILEDGEQELKLGNTNEFGYNYGLFYSCQLEKIYLGRTLSYDYSPFKGQSKIKTLTVGKKVTSLGKSIFSDCTALTSITIPASVTEIGNYAFEGCTAIKEVTLEDGEQELKLGKGLFPFRSLEKVHLGRTLYYEDNNSPFKEQPNLTTLTIGDKVTSLGKSAFFGGSALTSVTIPNSVTSIGESAFRGCSTLTTITIPASVTEIGNYAFYGCTAIREVTLEDDEQTLTLGQKLFYSCPIEKLYLGRGLSANAPFKDKFDLKDLTIGDKVAAICDESFFGCSALTSVFLPNSVTSVGESAFRGCSALTSVVIPNSVASIGSSAFRDCSALTTITIPASVTEIGNYAFDDCTAITEVTIEDGIETLKVGYYDISKGLFYSCPLEKLHLGRTLSYTISPFKNQSALTALTIGEKVTSIGESAFSGCSAVATVSIPNSVTSISSSAFLDCSALTSITIPASVTEIGNYAFNGCTAIKEVTLEDGEQELKLGYNDDSYKSELGLFYSCPLEKLYLGRTLSYTISPFKNQSTLTAVTIGEKVTSIGESTFSGCSGLTYITIPASVTEIGNYAFTGCTAIKEVTLEDGEQELKFGYNYDSYKSELGLFYSCPLEKLYLGRTLSYTISPFKNQSTLTAVTIGEKVISIGESAFSGCSALTAVTIPASVTEIDNNAFNNCSALTSVPLPNSITSIGESAFSGCSALTAITIPASVTEIGNYAFNGCTAIKEVTLEDGEQELTLGYNNNGGLFYSCPLEKLYLGRTLSYTISPFKNKSNLTALTIGDKVSSISESAFYGCSALTTVTIPNSVTSIGSDAFSNCSALASVTIGNSVTEIGSSAFSDCQELTSITFPESLTNIDDKAFYGCTGLTSVTLPAAVSKIGSQAFGGIEITKITALGNIPATITDDTFSEFTESYSDVWVPAGTFSLYKTAWPWLRVILETGCETDRTFAVQTPGSLISMIDPNKVEMITSLKLTGQINGTDLLTMNKMKNLKSLDLSEATIVSGGMPYYEEDNEKWGADDNTLGEYWSYNLPLLTKIMLPKNLEQIGEYAFSGKKYLEAISIPASVKSIGYGAFSGCTSVKELRLEDSAEVLEIDEGDRYLAMFAECPLEVLHLGRNLSYTRLRYPFSNRSALHTLTIGNTVTSIPDDAFSGCTKLTAVIIPNSVTEIGSSAFSGCSGLEKITIPDPVTSIRSNTFDGCSALTEVTLPGSLREIESSAFGGTALTDVYVINPVPPVIQESTFPASVTAAATLHVPEGSEGINWIHPYWGKFANIENWIVGTQSEFVAENVTYHITSEADATVEISAAALTGSRAGGIALTIPASVTFNGKTYRVAGIANNGFENCTAESVELPATIGYVGLEAFKGCANLTTLSVKAELPPSADVSSFDETAYATVKLSVPDSSKDAYSAHAVWGKFSLASIPNNPTDPENPDDGTDAIENIAGDTDISVSVESGAIIVTAPEGTPIEVYGMSGARVRSTREHRIDGLTRGVYIVRIGARTFKVAI